MEGLVTIISRCAKVPFSPQQMFDLVNNVAEYPQFLPWCAKTQVESQSENHMQASVHIVKGPISKAFSTINTLIPHERIEMRLKQGPFKHLEGVWSFEGLAQGCKVSFHLNFEFQNTLLALTMGPLFNQIAQTLLQAFTTRAHHVYTEAALS